MNSCVTFFQKGGLRVGDQTTKREEGKKKGNKRKKYKTPPRKKPSLISVFLSP